MDSIQDKIIKEASDQLSVKLDEVIIEGLKRKGFEFYNKHDITHFIKERCESKVFLELKQKVFYVDGNPFLLHHYGDSGFNIIPTEGIGVRATVCLGRFEFL